MESNDMKRRKESDNLLPVLTVSVLNSSCTMIVCDVVHGSLIAIMLEECVYSCVGEVERKLDNSQFFNKRFCEKHTKGVVEKPYVSKNENNNNH